MRRFFTLVLAFLFFLPMITMAQFPAPYCAETFPTNVEPITSVVFSNINNTSSPTVGGTPHENFTAIVGNVIMGNTYSMQVQGNTDGNFTTYVRVFIDFNNNSVFDIGESFDIGTIANSTGTDGITATANITIPTTAAPGNLRMRVSKRFNVYPAACNAAGFGQAEDYTLNLIPNTPCSGTPNAGTAVSTSVNIVCAGTPITLSLQGSTLASGLTYQWESSTDNITFGSITGATSSSYTTIQTLPVVYYRARVICGASSANSTSVMVTSASGPTYATLPYTESFENTWINGCNTRDIPNVSWKNAPNTGNPSWRRDDDGAAAAWTTPATGIYAPTASVGSRSARFHSDLATAGSRGQLDLYFDGNTAVALKRISFDYINTNGADSLVISLSTNGGTSFTRLDSVTIATAWTTKNLTFNTTSATSVLRFEAYSDAGTTDFGLDNITLITFADCVGTPTGGTTASTLTNVCTEFFTLSVTGASSGNGISYQWQRSTDNGNTWTNITGANALTYTTNQFTTTQYRLLTTCSFSAASATSTPVQVTSPVAAAGIYTIDNTFATNIPARTFNNFNDAYNFIKCGINASVLFNVQTGTGPYNEQLIMTAVPGTSPTKTVTFKGNGAATIRFAATNANERAVIKLRATKFIIFDSLVIDATAGTYGYGVQLINTAAGAGADSNIVRNCIINTSTASTLQNYAGIVVNGTDAGPIATGLVNCDDNVFDNNTITGGYYGITLVSTLTGGAPLRNTISNNKIIDFYSYGIYVSGTGNTLVEGNTIKRPTRATVTDFQGIYFTATSLNCIVTRNRIRDPFGGNLASTANFYGINFASVAPSAGNDNYVQNNLIYRVNGNGPQYGIANTGSSNVSYFHNTIALDSAASTSASTARGFYQTTAASGIDFYNNLISITRGGSGAKHAIYLGSGLLRSSDYNDFYVNSTNAFVGFYTANRILLADWRTATAASSFDLNSISTNPAFINLDEYSPGNAGMDNKGIDLGIPNDILGNPRPFVAGTSPDMGAYEFTPPACSTPPVIGTTSINLNNICQNTPVLLTLNIGAYGSAHTFQWQTSTSATGPFTSFGDPMLTPDTTIKASTTFYYRAAISCGSTTLYSDAVQLIVIPALPAGTYTIDKGNPTTYTGPGTGTNFNSFNAAKSAMSCGILGAVVFNVVPGSGPAASPYNEQLVLDSIKGTSPVNTIIFNGNGNTIQFSSSNANDRAVIKLRGADYIRFDSLRIDATGTGIYGYGVQLINRADSNIFRNCNIVVPISTSTNHAGIVINSSEAGPIALGSTLSDENLFDRNTITGGYYGITVIGGSTADLYITNNKFTRNTVTDFFSVGMQLSGTTGTLIELNNFSRPTVTSFASPVTGILVQSAPNNSLSINRNRFYNMFGGLPTSTATFNGIHHNNVDASAGSANRITNNLFYKINHNGPINALYNVGSDNVFYYHNTIALDEAPSTATSQTAAFNQNTAAVGLEFKNNLITIRRGGTGAKYGIYLGTNTSEVASDYNNVYLSGAGGTANYFGFFNANRITLNDWKVATTTKDLNSLDLNPLFVDTLNGNYMPGAKALNNKGTNVNVLLDILGVTRPDPADTTTPVRPDIGAYEFAPPPCVNPPVAGVASVTPNSGICLETPIHLTLTGNSPVGSITFQWQSSTSSAGPWTNIGPLLFDPNYDTLATTDTYYRALVTCGNGAPVPSTVAQITLGTIIPAGSYTISSAPTNYVGQVGANFNTFQEAVNAMLCGIGGKLVFNVAPGTYNEQIRVPYIRGTSSARTVTFQAANGLASSVNLTYGSSLGTANYTLKLDSTRNFIFNNLTITATDATFGRTVEFASNASFDSLLNCKIVAPVATFTTTNVAGVFATALKGTNNVIKGNTITNGAYGIYYGGTGVAANLTVDHIIDSNYVNDFYSYGIYATFQKRAKLTRNTINMTNAANVTVYGLYATDCDSSYEVVGNNVNITGTTGTQYGIYVNASDTSVTARGRIANNKVIGSGTNAGSNYGLYIANSPGHYAVNNVIALNNTGAIAYGLFSNSTEGIYYNNSVHLTSTSFAGGYAGYFNNPATSNIKIRNNIFSNAGGGRAMYVNNTSQSIASDYNMLYTSGATLVQRGTPAANFANLSAWSTASFWDNFSIVYAPAFTSSSDLQPDLANPDVWAMHGRGIQMGDNTYDYFNKPRPTTLTTGVPDLGAYEFFPTAQPTVLTATPAVPAANLPQVFMYGTDTVMRITWGATVPPSVQVRRFSGVVPSNLGSRPDSMYFYTKVESPNGGNYPFTMEQFYLDPWQGSIPDQNQIGLGRTTASNAWLVGFNSRVDTRRKLIRETSLTFFDKFTGLINPYAPPVLPDKDSSNRGRRFWVAYPVNQLAGGQEMVLYLSAQEAATVQVKINGTTWTRTYSVPANSVRVSDLIPKTGADNAFINIPGLSNRGISITSDVPIVAYAHVYGSASSGASMLMPIGVWGYEYKTLGITQNYGLSSFAYYYVIADNDDTKIEITSTPGIAVQNTGVTPGTPFTVTLNKGEFYQVVATSQTEELSGSLIKSVPNAQGKCYPIASFSGSSRTAINCPAGAASGGDFIMQQNFPSTAWGKRYLTAPSSSSTIATQLQTNIYRVAVKDPATVVRRNGVALTGLQQNFYYQFNSNTADYIEADRPIMVAQFLADGGCPGTGVGDPEMIYLSPIEQGINKIGFYRNTNQAITVNYLTLIVPTAALPSLTIVDGATTVTPDYTYPHPQNALTGNSYTVVVKRWTAAQQQVRVQSDSAFTAITYGLGSVESYGYNAGTLVKTLNANLSISNDSTGTSTTASEYNCVGTPFRFKTYLPLIPTSITWKFSAIPSISPNTDSIIVNPVPVDSIIVNRTKYYGFIIRQNFIFGSPGLYPVQINYSHPDVESCDKTIQNVLYVQVVPAPKTNFAINFQGCEGNTAQFTAEAITSGGLNVNSWSWIFHDNTTATGQTASHTYNTAGTYNINLHTTTPDGCIGDSTKPIVVNPRPVVNVVADSLVVCSGSDTTFRVQNPVTGTLYNWYTSAVGGTSVFTGPDYTITNITAPADYYVEGVSAAGCNSVVRKKVVVRVFQALALPVASVTSATSNSLTFGWAAVPGAVGYQVSTNNGVTFVTPSSGATGLTHTIGSLTGLQTVCIIVKALGTTACQNSISTSVCSCNTPLVVVSPDSLAVCSGANATFNVQSPVAGTTYSWYTLATGGTALATGPSFVVNNVTATAVYYVGQSTTSGCTSPSRTRVVVSVFQPLASTVVTFNTATATATSVSFSWTAVTGAVSYQVSVDGGTTFTTPSSGATGLTHTITGLGTLQQVCIIVRAVGANSCQNSVSISVCGCTNSAAQVVQNTSSICSGSTATFTVQNPVTGITYTWWTAATGGTLAFTGSNFTTPVLTATTIYYVQQSSAAGCVSSTRTPVTVTLLSALPQTVVTASSATSNSVTFTWTAVSGATGYQVSLDNGATYITPNSGATGLSHTVTGLSPLQQVTILVRALGSIACQNSVSAPVTGRALGDQLFIPNTFTPNGDGRNDFLEMFGDAILDVKFMVFNQWGEKLVETNGATRGPNGGIRIWDGTHKGKTQPIGVYIYACRITLIDGSVIEKKGSINLVR
jgi:gliding motility-associated-like protein